VTQEAGADPSFFKWDAGSELGEKWEIKPGDRKDRGCSIDITRSILVAFVFLP